MNGRIYDPTLGRMLQADQHIQAPKNSQSYNRYAYMFNNPLSYTDPSGYISLKSIYKGLMKLDGRWAAHKFTSKRPWAHQISMALSNYYGGPSAVIQFDHTFFQTGSLSKSFKSGAITAIVSYASSYLGQTYGAGSWQSIAGNAVVGGVAADLQGGNFGHGFWSAGLGTALGVLCSLPITKY